MIIDDIFTIKRGGGIYFQDYGKGNVPLVSAKIRNNGVIGLVDENKVYDAPLITVERVTGKAFVQIIDFNAVPDDVYILMPKKIFNYTNLLEIAAQINNERWRFSYARKVTPDRLRRIPIFFLDFSKKIDISKQLPPKNEIEKIENTLFENYSLNELFKVYTGDFHSVNELDEGNIPLISCSTEDNGICGFYNISNENTYANKITIAYDGQPLTAKYHPYKFAAYDNVGVLIPKLDFPIETIIYIVWYVNNLKWRYSYGRKCYHDKIKNIEIKIPSKDKKINHKWIKSLMNTSSYWKNVCSQFLQNIELNITLI